MSWLRNNCLMKSHCSLLPGLPRRLLCFFLWLRFDKFYCQFGWLHIRFFTNGSFCDCLPSRLGCKNGWMDMKRLSLCRGNMAENPKNQKDHEGPLCSPYSNWKSKCYEETNAIILVTFTRHTINLVVHVEYINCMLKNSVVQDCFIH